MSVLHLPHTILRPSLHEQHALDHTNCMGPPQNPKFLLHPQSAAKCAPQYYPFPALSLNTAIKDDLDPMKCIDKQHDHGLQCPGFNVP
ncbi:Glutathione transporter 1 [Venturia inaequalis]|nr:Glutathione transporter 1 [Venturia inaequalis]